jgi:hypothetical protein
LKERNGNVLINKREEIKILLLKNKRFQLFGALKNLEFKASSSLSSFSISRFS